MRNDTKYDAATGLLSRHGHLIGRAVPMIKKPSFGPACCFYELFDRENRQYGFATDYPGVHLFYMTILEAAAAIPNYMDMADPDGEMLTRCKQRRDMAAFQVALCRYQWREMRRHHRAGRPTSAAIRSALFQTYRQAQADAQRFTARVLEQEAADNTALIGIIETNRLLDGIYGRMAR